MRWYELAFKLSLAAVVFACFAVPKALLYGAISAGAGVFCRFPGDGCRAFGLSVAIGTVVCETVNDLVALARDLREDPRCLENLAAARAAMKKGTGDAE